jgi:mannosyltransferase
MEKNNQNSRTDFIDKHTRLILVALVLIAASLRWYHLDSWSVWNDEAHTVERCLGLDPQALADKYPLNFLLTKPFIHWLGPTELGGRLFPFLVSILSIPVVFLFTRRIFDEKVALLTAAFVTFSDWHLDWSQNARHYALLFVLTTCSAGWFYLGLEKDRLRYVLLSLLTLALAVLTHTSGAFLLPAYVIYPFLARMGTGRFPPGWNAKNVMVYGVPLGIGFLLAIPRSLNWLHYIAFERAAENPWWNVMGSVGFYLGIPLLVASVCGHWLLVSRGDQRGLFSLSIILAGGISLLLVTLVTWGSGAYNFYTLWPHAMVAGWMAVEIGKVAGRHSRILGATVPAIIILSYISNDFLYYTSRHGNRPRWKEAFAYVQSNMDPADEIYCSSGSVAWFYFGYQRKVGWLHDVNPGRLVQDRQPAWIVILAATENTLPGNRDLRTFITSQCQRLITFSSHTALKNRIVTVYQWDPDSVVSGQLPNPVHREQEGE